MTITEQIHKVVDKFESEINRDGKTTIIFKFENFKFDKFIKSYSKNANEIKLEITS